MDEIWKDIEGYGGTFQVSNLGRIKTFNYKNTGCENILKPKKHNHAREPADHSASIRAICAVQHKLLLNL